jgi:hypothetical protein
VQTEAAEHTQAQASALAASAALAPQTSVAYLLSPEPAASSASTQVAGPQLYSPVPVHLENGAPTSFLLMPLSSPAVNGLPDVSSAAMRLSAVTVVEEGQPITRMNTTRCEPQWLSASHAHASESRDDASAGGMVCSPYSAPCDSVLQDGFSMHRTTSRICFDISSIHQLHDGPVALSGVVTPVTSLCCASVV